MFWQPARGILQPGSWRRPQVPAATGPTQVRVTFSSRTGSSGTKVNNVSIGLQAPSGDLYDTAATPVELLCSGVSGFNLTAGTSITSDWANLAISTTAGVVFSVSQAGNDAGWVNYSVRNVVAPITGGAASGVILIYDMSSGPADLGAAPFGTGSTSYYRSGGGPSYNIADATQFNAYSATTFICTQIETQ